MVKKEIVLDVAMYPQQSKIPHLGHFNYREIKKGKFDSVISAEERIAE